jgi:hypothetical protein
MAHNFLKKSYHRNLAGGKAIGSDGFHHHACHRYLRQEASEAEEAHKGFDIGGMLDRVGQAHEGEEPP